MSAKVGAFIASVQRAMRLNRYWFGQATPWRSSVSPCKRIVRACRRKGFRALLLFAADSLLICVRNLKGYINVLIQFDSFLIDTDRRELTGADGVIHVEPQVFDLLLHFVQNSNRVVSKDELIERVWKGRIVSDAALNSRINAVRQAIGDTGHKQALIRTVPRRGFLFAGKVATEISSATHGAAPVGEPSQLMLPDKPSIAVLPFPNLSGDPEQEYFADGMVDDIITGLSRIKWLFVIARNSSFTYKGQAVDVKRIGRELGVRYVLEGSVRKAGDRVRINAQLVEAQTGVHLWAERYDRRLEDIFALQDEITLSVVGAIEPRLRDAEIERVKRKRPDNLDAYDFVLRAIPHAYFAAPDEASKALPLLEQALALEADYAGAHGLLAWCHEILFAWGGFKEDNRAAAIRHARAAITYGRDDATALALGAFVIGMVEHDRIAAREAFERALALSPSSAFTLFLGSIMLAYAGEAERSIECAERALWVSPLDRLAFAHHHALAIGHFLRGRYEEAANAARRAVQSNPGFSVAHSLLAAALARLGRTEEAHAAATRVLALQPSFSSGGICAAIGIAPSLAEALKDAWRDAGLPP
jgi:TolB-like protein